jgi:hypothetical protein
VLLPLLWVQSGDLAAATIDSTTVVSDGYYTITITGADGGSASQGLAGGAGATCTMVLKLTAGQVIRWVLGDPGVSGANAAGGGGSSALFIDSTEMMICGAGGGGDGAGGFGGPGFGGNADPNGDAGIGTLGGGGAAGVAGLGGGSGAPFLGDPLGGGGGGRLGAGAVNPGTGGLQATGSPVAVLGGAGSAAGGGAGYSGGGAATIITFGASAGGGGGYSGGGGAGAIGQAGGGGSIFYAVSPFYFSHTFTDGANGGGTNQAGTISIDYIPTIVVIDRVSLSARPVGDVLAALGSAGETAVEFDPDGDGFAAVLEWETLEERGTIGFYVERELADGQWQRINPEMLPGLITAPMGGQYLLVDPGVGPGEQHRYRILEQEAGGMIRRYGPYELEVQ